jgi:hypothetical protein
MTKGEGEGLCLAVPQVSGSVPLQVLYLGTVAKISN